MALLAFKEGMSIRAAADKFGVSTMSLQRKTKKIGRVSLGAEITTVPNGTVVKGEDFQPPAQTKITTVPNGTVVKGRDGRTYRNSYLPETIAKAIELQSKGKTIAAIAREVEAPYMTVSRWLKKPRPEPAAAADPPSLILESPVAAPKPKRPQVPDSLRQVNQRERRWLRERWIQIADHLAKAEQLIRLEHHRLQSEYAGPQGSLMMTNRWEALAKLWAESGEFQDFTAATGNPEAVTLAGLFSELERSSRVSSQLIGSIETWTGCRSDPTRYQPTPSDPHA